MKAFLPEYLNFCFNFIEYKTYDDLFDIVKKQVTDIYYDVIIHSAAVSDYKVEGVYTGKELTSVDNTGKVSSSYEDLYLKLVPTQKIIDQIRYWGFNGKLVKFKLEVDKTDEELIEIAKKSMKTSYADIIVANCLEWASEHAYIIDDKNSKKVPRDGFEFELISKLESCVSNRSNKCI
jgi:phosphopantothenoylcysteine synthetase/decarboxylase